MQEKTPFLPLCRPVYGVVMVFVGFSYIHGMHWTACRVLLCGPQPRIVLVDNFLSEAECEELLSDMKPGFPSATHLACRTTTVGGAIVPTMMRAGCCVHPFTLCVL